MRDAYKYSWAIEDAEYLLTPYYNLVFIELIYGESLAWVYEDASDIYCAYVLEDGNRADKFLHFLAYVITTGDGSHISQHYTHDGRTIELVYPLSNNNTALWTMLRAASGLYYGQLDYSVRYLDSLANMIEDKLGRKVPRVSLE